MDLTSALEYNHARPVALFLITAKQHLVHWTNDAVYTDSWYSATTYRVVAASEDGAALTERATLALCDANDGSYFWDSANARLYVNPTAADPRSTVLLASVRFHVSNYPKRLNSIQYDARVRSAPNVSRRIPEIPGEVGQIGGGTLEIANAGLYDTLQADNVILVGGTVQAMVGADVW